MAYDEFAWPKKSRNIRNCFLRYIRCRTGRALCTRFVSIHSRRLKLAPKLKSAHSKVKKLFAHFIHGASTLTSSCQYCTICDLMWEKYSFWFSGTLLNFYIYFMAVSIFCLCWCKSVKTSPSFFNGSWFHSLWSINLQTKTSLVIYYECSQEHNGEKIEKSNNNFFGVAVKFQTCDWSKFESKYRGNFVSW